MTYAGRNICATCASKKYISKDYENNKKKRAQREKERRKRLGVLYNIADRLRNKNPSRIASKKKNMLDWQRSNKEHLKEYRKKYRETQNEKVKTWDQNKRVRKNNAGKLSSEEWNSILKRYNHSCYYCGKSNIHLEQEHKTPLIRGGKHNKENVVPACRECNAKKYTKTEEEFLAVIS